jgi:hypothetical protein
VTNTHHTSIVSYGLKSHQVVRDSRIKSANLKDFHTFILWFESIDDAHRCGKFFRETRAIQGVIPPTYNLDPNSRTDFMQRLHFQGEAMKLNQVNASISQPQRTTSNQIDAWRDRMFQNLHFAHRQSIAHKIFEVMKFTEKTVEKHAKLVYKCDA